jgi:hypothetical protein
MLDPNQNLPNMEEIALKLLSFSFSKMAFKFN